MSPTHAPGDRKWLALALLACAQFVVVLDASIVNVALPSIGRDLEFEPKDLSWVINAYVLTFGGFLLLGGRMADLLGRRRMFIAGLVLFAVASFVGGLAESQGQLIAARALQGLGGALLSPAALSIVTNMFTEGAERNKALGVWGAVAGSGGAVGVLLGGVLTDGLGWEWVLFVNTPICLAVAFLATRLVPESRSSAAKVYDIAGAVTITVGLSLFVYALVDANDAGWGSAQTIGLLAAAIGLIVAFVFIERSRAEPLVPLPGVFRIRTVVGANISGILIAASLFSMFFFITLYLQQVMGYDAMKAGLSYLPLSAGIIFSAGMASVLVTKLGYKPVLVAGLVLIALGLAWFSQVSPDGTYVGDVLFPSLLAALGLGFAFVPVTIAAVSGVEPDEAGLASGLINTSQQIGGALGLAVLTAVWTSRTDPLLEQGAPPPVALTEGFQNAFMVGSGIAIAGAILAAVLISSKDSKDHAEAAQRGEVDAVPVAA
jgi:EmrB/QacA subfamily drug resistance transporter